MIDFLWSNSPLSLVSEKFKLYPSKESWEDYPAFTFDYEADTEKVSDLVAEIELNYSELIITLGSLSVIKSLKDAAYFADYAMINPSLQPKGVPSASYYKFLQPNLLRQFVQYPMEGQGGNKNAYVD
jgi:hypothetical protein